MLRRRIWRILTGICFFKVFYRGVGPAGIEGVQGSGASPPGIECTRMSIFKMTGRLVLMSGFHIELSGAGLDLAEHQRRTLEYTYQHNRTEDVKNRKSLSQILESALSIED